MTTVDVNPLILRWAQHRSGHSDTKMRTRFPTWGFMDSTESKTHIIPARNAS